jgi:small redox-active disulfide protein 2
MKKVEVLGMGCPKCQATLKNVEEAIETLKIDAEVIKVEDLAEIAAYGVMITPAVAVDGEVVILGRIPTVGEIEQLLQRDLPRI